MAEERIVVLKTDRKCKYRVGCETFVSDCTEIDYVCGKFNIDTFECPEEVCAKCKHKKPAGMTRQEAIKKIETHLKASTIKFSTTPDVVAEIALNALLEGK